MSHDSIPGAIAVLTRRYSVSRGLLLHPGPHPPVSHATHDNGCPKLFPPLSPLPLCRGAKSPRTPRGVWESQWQGRSSSSSCSRENRHLVPVEVMASVRIAIEILLSSSFRTVSRTIYLSLSLLSDCFVGVVVRTCSVLYHLCISSQ